MTAATTLPPGRAGRSDRPSRPRLTPRQRLSRADVRWSPYLYISPFFVLFALVGLFPLGYTFVVSLNHWDLLSGPGEWIGLKNFTDELADPLFWNSMLNTLSIFVLSAVPQVTIALVLAALLDANLRGKTFWRMSVLLPYVVTPVAVALIFSSLFGETYGLINNLLGAVGIDPVQWKQNRLASHLAIATMINWRWTGYNALILLAAMQAVPRDLYESAALDGASAVRRFFSITIPSIRPDDHLRGDHRDHRRAAGVHRAQALRRHQRDAGRRVPAVPDHRPLPVGPRLQPRRLRQGRRRGLAAVHRRGRHRPDQLRDLPQDRLR